MSPLEVSSSAHHYGRMALLLAGGVLALLLTGCGIFNTAEAARRAETEADSKAAQPLSDTVIVMAPPTMSRDVTAESRRLALPAMLAYLVYLNHLPPAARNRPDCHAYIHDHPISTLDSRSPQQGAWRRWAHELGCFSDHGLYYEVYVFRKGESIEQAVIAIRGTENLQGQMLPDWWNNFAVPFFGIDPTEYQYARKRIGDAIAKLREPTEGGPGIKIYLTGHSLGGGMAQQSAYLERVEATYVFNTSPVTNWANIKLDPMLNAQMERNGTSDPTIIRVTEHGEFLDYVRWVTSRVNSRRYNRTDYLFHFTEPHFVKSHSMAVMACNFAARLAQVTPDAKGEVGEFAYTRDMALALLRLPKTASDGEGLCTEKSFSPEWNKQYRPAS